MAVEIERKFLVTEPPPGDVVGDGVPLRQGYLAGEGDVETRVRIAPRGAWITVKAGRGVSRTEKWLFSVARFSLLNRSARRSCHLSQTSPECYAAGW